MTSAKSKWHFQKLAGYTLAGLILLFSWIWPPTHAVWETIDLFAFRSLNGTLPNHPLWQQILAFFSLRKTDILFDIVMLLILLVPTCRQKKLWRLNVSKILFIALYLFFVMKILNHFLIHIGDFHCRNSPSLALDGAFRLSIALGNTSIRDKSSCSFPSDHALSFMLFAALTYGLFGRRIGRIAWTAALVFCLPRLINGAHWLTDQVVGSASLTLVACALAFGTPLSAFFVKTLERILKGKKS